MGTTLRKQEIVKRSSESKHKSQFASSSATKVKSNLNESVNFKQSKNLSTSCQQIYQKTKPQVKSTKKSQQQKNCKETVDVKGGERHANIGDGQNIFIIPELPQGKLLEFRIHSTWGDQNYVGLNGLEIFNYKGDNVRIEKVSNEFHFV